MEGDEPIVIKDWVRERILGSGGFGIVTLWRNTATDDLIAVKKGKPGIESILTKKHRERWIQEVKMMQEMQHENIVSYKPLPDVLRFALEPFNKSKLPMLSMEYCTGGDLRETLNRSANCCGLPESACRDILADIKNAVQYLHEHDIAHRDLKPENIVLQQCPERSSKFIYKLTDLGYAKELDANSMDASLVGTLQYLAPEILMSNTYSNSVDYWSFGLLAFEIICGVRPFLPSYDLKPWLEKVRKKKSEDICIYETPNNEIIYSDQMFSTNHVTKTFKNEMEKWLKIALEWDPKKRGRINSEIVVFSMLDRILTKKILSVFSVYSYQFLSYEIDDSTMVSTLQGWIDRDIQLPVDEQFLLNFDGDEVHSTDFCTVTFDEHYTNGPMLYVYRKGEILPLIKEKITPPSVPKDIKWVLSHPDQKMKHFHQKRIYAQGLYFVFQESRSYDTLLDACLFKLNYLIKKFTNSRTILRKMSDDSVALYAQKEFAQKMLNFDLEKNKNKEFSIKWQNRFQKITSDIDKLKNEVTAKLITRYESAYRRSAQLSTTYGEMYSKEQYKEHDLIKCFGDALDCYHNVKTRSKEQQRSSFESCRPMTQIIYDCFKYRQNLLQSVDLHKYMQQINFLTKEYETIVAVMLNAEEHLVKYQEQLWRVQSERQQDIWSLLTEPSENADIKNPQFVLGNPNIPKEQNTQTVKLQQPVQFIVGDPKLAKVNNVPSLNNKHSLDSQMDNLIETFPSINMETTEIINNNISLRNRLLAKTNEGFSQYQKLFNDYSCEFDFLKQDTK